MGIKLSILIPSVHTRRNTFLPKLQDEVYRQLDGLPDFERTQVEVLVLSDNKKLLLGEKRNIMVEMAQGEYIQFLDDDDTIEPDLIKELLDGIKTGADVITFHVSVTLNGGVPKIARYSREYGRDYNTAEGYYRIPNHICCVKREKALLSSFPSLKYAEDQAYAKLLLPHLVTEHRIERVLYHYDYDDNVTETQYQNMPEHIRKRREQPPIIDVVFLSRATTPALADMAQKAIDTCLAGANQLPVSITVIEQAPGVSYRNAETVYHSAPFNYNAFANLGARKGTAPWLMVANSDLMFHHGWLHELLTSGAHVASPHEPNDPRQQDINANTSGYVNGKHFSGWCFMIKRSLWEDIGGFDEDFPFWFADDSAIEQVKAAGYRPMLVKNAIVEHLGSTTLAGLPMEQRDGFTWGLVERFNTKYGKNKFEDSIHYAEWKKRTGVSA